MVIEKTWAERADEDPTLKAFVEASIARAYVELQALRVENEHQREVIAEQKLTIDGLRLKREQAEKGRTRSPRTER